jgi:hypothetical protein
VLSSSSAGGGKKKAAELSIAPSPSPLADLIN